MGLCLPSAVKWQDIQGGANGDADWSSISVRAVDTMNQTRPPRSFPTRRSMVVVCVSLVVALIGSAGPLLAQDDDGHSSDKLDEIRAEQERVEGLRVEAARGIDGTLADISELTEAMAVLESEINKQVLDVATATAKLSVANQRFGDSTEAVTAAELALVELEKQVRERAVEAFIGQDVSTPDIVYTDQPNLTVRMQSLLNAVLTGEADIADAYAAVRNELAVERENARLSRISAEKYRLEVETVQRKLEADREIQQELIAASEIRLERLLSERQSLEALGIDLEQAEQRELNRLARELARYSGPGGLAGPIATPDEIVWVRGIAIHHTVADNLEALLAAAEADGILLAGGGWRDAQAQVRLRQAHCGTSDHAIWEAPPSSCRPPTARPGSSNHERGLAIDFTDDGRSINSRNSPGYRWLAANASRFGFYNLPSEPWHWSTTGS